MIKDIKLKLSVIIPTYNEASRLPKCLEKIDTFLKNNKFDYEIIVIDDGSKDDTSTVTKKYDKCRTLINNENRGKGYSVKRGFLDAKKDWVLLTDSDLSTPIEELELFLKFRNDYDILIGSRALKDSKVKALFYKKFLGRASNAIINLLAVKDIKDTQCGFKMFNRIKCEKIFRKQTIHRWGFDFELLHLAQKYNLKIKEIPVVWVNDEASKVKLSDYPKTLMELLKVKINDLTGRYLM